MAKERRIILVTGMPRSGTTTVGDVLGTAPHTAALYEPMNFHSGDRIIQCYFEIPGSGDFSTHAFDNLVKRITTLSLHLKSGVWPEDSGLRRIAKYAIGGRSRTSLRKARFSRSVETLIWKDPIAAFTVRRLAETHGSKSVITLRSPFAVASSFKRLSWGFDLSSILPRAQSVGMSVDPQWQGQDIENNVTNAAILWSLVYGEQLTLAQERPDMVRILDLEKLILSPFETYRELFDWLGLPMTDATMTHLHSVYGEKGARPQAEVPGGKHAHDKARDVSQANHYWRKLLTEAEVETVADITRPVREQFGVFRDPDFV